MEETNTSSKFLSLSPSLHENYHAVLLCRLLWKLFRTRVNDSLFLSLYCNFYLIFKRMYNGQMHWHLVCKSCKNYWNRKAKREFCHLFIIAQERESEFSRGPSDDDTMNTQHTITVKVNTSHSSLNISWSRKAGLCVLLYFNDYTIKNKTHTHKNQK